MIWAPSLLLSMQCPLVHLPTFYWQRHLGLADRDLTSNHQPQLYTLLFSKFPKMSKHVSKAGMHAFHFTLFFYIIVYLRSEPTPTLTIPQVKTISRTEELYQDHKEYILGALKDPFGEDIPNNDSIYRDAQKLLLEECSIQDYITFWRHR